LNLLEIADALNGPGILFGPGEGREQHGSQDRDDGDDNQQFDQREAPTAFVNASGFRFEMNCTDIHRVIG
jgi:hypothetical protein